MLRGGQIEPARDLILAFASNERVDQSAEGVPEIRPFESQNNFFDQAPAVVQHPTDNTRLQGSMPVSRHPSNVQFRDSWGSATPMFNVPDLQYRPSQPSFTQVPSDSGVGSMASEPQGRGMEAFHSTAVEGTASPGVLGYTQAGPFFSMNRAYPPTDNLWAVDSSEEPLWEQSNGEAAFEDFEN